MANPSEDDRRVSREVEKQSFPTSSEPPLTLFEKYTYVAGPLPSPQALVEFEKALPGLAERVVHSFEVESEHVREIELLLAKGQIEDMRRFRGERRTGQIFGFSIALTFGVLSVFTTLHGSQVVGAILGGSTLVTLTTAFLYNREEARVAVSPKNPEHAKLPTATRPIE